jgi:hypothetical protein
MKEKLYEIIKNMFKSMLEDDPVQTMRAYEGTRVIDQLVLNVEVSGRHLKLRLLYPKTKSSIPIE